MKTTKAKRMNKTDKLTAIMLALLITTTGVLFAGCGASDAAKETAAAAADAPAAEAVHTGESRIVPADSSITLDPGETQALVTAVNGNEISVSIGGFDRSGFGGKDGAQGGTQNGAPGEFGGNGFGTPDENSGSSENGNADAGRIGGRGGMGETGGRGGMQGGAPGGMGGASGFSDLTGNGKDATDTANGELPSMPDGQTPPDMANGELPSMPDGQTPPDTANGELPSMPDGRTPPDMENGELPAMPDGGTPPDMENGELPAMPDGQTPPDMAVGEGFGGKAGGRGFGRGGVSATVTVADEGIIFNADGSAAALADLTEGALLTVTVGENGAVTKIVINARPSDGNDLNSGL